MTVVSPAQPTDRYDTVVIGAGPGGRGVADALVRANQRVAMVEAELVGGECPYWACIPSKTLLRPGEALAADARIAGVGRGAIDWPALVAYRDYMNSGLNDSGKVAAAEEAGIDVLRGRGRIAGPGRVSVHGGEQLAGRMSLHAGERLAARELVTENIVISTGTSAALPDLPGLEGVPYWTNREATSLREVPDSAIVLGGGPVGVELAQMLRRFGSDVTLVHPGVRLLEREHHTIGELLGELLRAEGIAVRTEAEAVSVAAVAFWAGRLSAWETTLRPASSTLMVYVPSATAGRSKLPFPVVVPLKQVVSSAPVPQAETKASRTGSGGD